MYTSWRWPSWNVKEEYLCNKCGVPQSYLSVYCQFCYTLYSVISIAGTYCFFVLKAFTEQGRMIKMFLVNICLLITALMGYLLSHSLKWFRTPLPISNCFVGHFCPFMMVVSWNLAHSSANLRIRTQDGKQDDARCKCFLVTTTWQARDSGVYPLTKISKSTRCDTSVVWVKIWKYFTLDVFIEHCQVSSRPCLIL